LQDGIAVAPAEIGPGHALGLVVWILVRHQDACATGDLGVERRHPVGDELGVVV
jgi:hypothetical protein